MSNLYEGLVAYCRLYQVIGLDNGQTERRIIGDNTLSIDMISEEMMGLEEVTIKFAGNSVTIKADLPIHQNIIEAAAIENSKTSKIHQLFSLDADWEVEYGWGGVEESSKISNMKLVNWGIVYDQSIRSFKITLEFIPATTFLLKDIKLHMLKDEVERIKKAINSNLDSDEIDFRKVGHPASLGNIITELLEGCKNLVGTVGYQIGEKKDYPVKSPPINRETTMLDEVELWRPLLDMIARGESGPAGYNAWNNGVVGDSRNVPVYSLIGKNLVDCTFNEIMEYQKNPNRKFFAVGRYQVVPTVMIEYLRGSKAVKGEDIFDSIGQDKFAVYDLIIRKRSTINIYVKTKEVDASMELKALRALAQEWASITDPIKKTSYYDGDSGGNHASISLEEAQATLNGIRNNYQSMTTYPDNTLSTLGGQQPRMEDTIEHQQFEKPDKNNKFHIIKKSESSEPEIAYMSEALFYGKKSDIPNPSDIRLAVFGSIDPNMTPYEKMIAFNAEKVSNEASFDYLKESYKDVSVLQFIVSLLQENGFTIFPTVANLSKDGKIGWMIIQTNFNNIGGNVEKEYIGINIVEKPEAVSNGDKWVNTIVNDKNGTMLFDLHSNKNVIISINANVDNGESSIGTILATQMMSEEGVPSGQVMRNVRNEIFSYLAGMAKTVDLTCMGISSLKWFDNIYVNLGGPLFSGLYKIIELEHKIDSGFETSFTAIQTRDGLPNRTIKSDEQEVKPDTPISVTDTILSVPTGSVGNRGR